MADVVVVLDEAALLELLNTPDGPVGVVIGELGAKATTAARALAPVMKPENFSNWGKAYDPRYQYGPPGRTFTRIHEHFPGYNRFGQIYASANAPFAPTVFLQRPAEQILSTRYRFMSGALDTVTL